MTDISIRDQVEAELREAAALEVADELVRTLLASDPDPEPWQVGEAIAEVLLSEWHGAVWVWNQGRDRRTPLASLPGADLVGFWVQPNGEVKFLFGEVKSSADLGSPPNVLYGRSGLVHQLEALSSRAEIAWTLIKWLRARCLDASAVDLFKRALAAHATSDGKDLLLVGCLLRDTAPSELDVKHRGEALAGTVPVNTTVQLRVWHLPDKLANWGDYLGEASDG